jgi:hypothetical protein
MRYPTLPTGHFHHVELRPFLHANGKQNDTAHQRQPAEQRRNVDMLVLIRGGMDWPDIQNFFPMRIVEPLEGERKTAQHDEENATPDEWFHGDRSGG